MMATRLEWIPKLCKSQLGVKLTQGCILKMLCLSIRAKRSMSISRLLFSKSTAWKIGGTCVSNNLVIPLTTLCATFIVLIHHVHHHHHHHHYHVRVGCLSKNYNHHATLSHTHTHIISFSPHCLGSPSQI